MTTSRASWRIRYISQNRRVFRKQDTSKQTCVYQNRRVFIKTDVCLSKQTCVYQNRRVFMKQDTYACEQRHQCTWKKTPMHLKKKSDIAVFAYYVLYYYDSVCQLRHHRERFGAWYYVKRHAPLSLGVFFIDKRHAPLSLGVFFIDTFHRQKTRVSRQKTRVYTRV